MRINERRAVVMARLFYRKPFVRMAKIEELQCALKELVDFFLVDLVWGEEFVEVEVRKTSVGHASGQKLPQAAGSIVPSSGISLNRTRCSGSSKKLGMSNLQISRGVPLFIRIEQRKLRVF